MTNLSHRILRNCHRPEITCAFDIGLFWEEERARWHKPDIQKQMKRLCHHNPFSCKAQLSPGDLLKRSKSQMTTTHADCCGGIILMVRAECLTGLNSRTRQHSNKTE